jgi:glutamate formiminotransferase/formiminotetrahydrofolate cyclodeaminase
MTVPEGLIGLSLAGFAHAAASMDPAPGSGSVAAAVGALGASLGSMALRSGRDEVPNPGREGSRELEGLAAELLGLVDEDARAYSAYLAARRGGGDLGGAVERSIAVPRHIAELSARALEQLCRGSGAVRPRLHSEVVTASRSLLAAVEGATFTAASNLPGLADSARAGIERAALAALSARARELVQDLDRTLEPAR